MQNINWEEYPEALKVLQAAELLQIGKNQMYELCRRTDFPAVKFGRQLRISKTLLKDWFNAKPGVLCNYQIIKG